ncbi:MAG: hypothetical protein M1444_02600 [Patescibacteria group bacterium]|nr:hypothetical protein [Patescibacteria group bacterium]
MSDLGETFFTSVGCMDGRVQETIAVYGRAKFGVLYADTITEAGLVGLLSNNPSEEFLESIKKKVLISVEKHHSKGILVHGHQECAGNQVDDGTHKDDVRKSVEVIKQLINNQAPVVGVFVKRSISDPKIWEAEEV